MVVSQCDYSATLGRINRYVFDLQVYASREEKGVSNCKKLIMEILGRIAGQSLKDLYSWIENQPLDKAVHSSYAPNRIEKWYGFGSNLQSLKLGRHCIFAADNPGNRSAFFCLRSMLAGCALRVN